MRTMVARGVTVALLVAGVAGAVTAPRALLERPDVKLPLALPAQDAPAVVRSLAPLQRPASAHKRQAAKPAPAKARVVEQPAGAVVSEAEPTPVAVQEAPQAVEAPE